MKRVTKAKSAHRPAKAAAAESPLWLPALVIVALTLLAYFPVLRATFIWDDDAYLTNNRLIVLPGGLLKIWFEPTASPQYYPLVFTTFWIEHKVWGLWPAGSHLVNVLLHAGSAVLLWRILRWLAVPGAVLAAMVFAVHPVQVESVAWITERKNTLSTFFYLAALLTYLRFALAGGPAPAHPRRTYLLSL
ncbi:MAG TPA: O-GlcNAc transferase, partial [Phycisphaerae bacterium]|nr:O-GlcNAc transferase [Phycisphaerae bacterium]